MVENMDLDQLEIAILGQLYMLEDDVLTHLCTPLKVSKEGKTKRNLLKEVRAVIESETSGADDHVFRQFLETIFRILNAPISMPALEGNEEERVGAQDAVAAKEELERLVKVQQDLHQKVVDLSLKVKNGSEEVQEISDLRLYFISLVHFPD